MPDRKSSERKRRLSRRGAVGSIVFALFFNIVLFIVAPLIITNLAFHRPGLGGSARWSRRTRVGWRR